MFDPEYNAKGEKSVFNMSFSSMYYNPIASFWEPFIEPSELEVITNKNSLKLKTIHKLNVNVSETLVKVLSMTWKSWNEKEPRCLVLEKNSRRESKKAQGICPFFLKNDSGVCIYLSKATKARANVTSSQESAIPNGDTTGITMDYEETIENLVNNGNNVRMTDAIFQIRFDSELNYRPMNGLRLNSVGSGVHFLTGEKERLNCLVYTISMDKMIKLVTLRTPISLTNKTDFTLRIVFYPKTEQEQIYTLRVGSSLSIPVTLMHADFTITQPDMEPVQLSLTPAVLHRHFSTHSTVPFLYS